MAAEEAATRVERRLIDVTSGTLAVFAGGSMVPGAPVVCAAHPAGVFGDGAVDLLREAAETRVVCVNPRGIGQSSAAPAGYTLEAMADDLDAVRGRLGVER